tara:strand:+ start:798 stop:1595 length:798 start_codon:yes stop_codon:yes gene_type:complete
MLKKNFALNYLSNAPLSLAFERIIEAHLYKNEYFHHPILDIGCGEGLFASMVFTPKIDLGIDPNSRELSRAKALGAYTKLKQCYGDNIGDSKEKFNTIFSNSVLEHIEDIKPVLRETRKKLSDTGYFYATVPSNNFERYSIVCTILELLKFKNLARNFRIFYNKFWVHYHAYDIASWRELFSECGLEVVEAYSYAPRAICMLNDLLVPTALLDKVCKSQTNRWVLFPRIRKILVFPIYLFMNPILKKSGKCKKGGLIYLKAKVKA